MTWFALKYARDPSLHVADVGSCDVNGSFREIFEHCSYTGLDVVPGKGVDRIIKIDDFGSEQYDVVISGSTLEHVEDMSAWFDGCVSIAKPGGLLCIIAPHGMSGFDEHFHPLDCWRIWPHGMRWLARRLEVIRCWRDVRDTVLFARKPT